MPRLKDFIQDMVSNAMNMKWEKKNPTKHFQNKDRNRASWALFSFPGYLSETEDSLSEVIMFRITNTANYKYWLIAII